MRDSDELSKLRADADRAWAKYNELVSELPDCEHNREWHEECARLRAAHQVARRKYDKAIRAANLPEGGKDIRA